jgi:hypothetical protein
MQGNYDKTSFLSTGRISAKFPAIWEEISGIPIGLTNGFVEETVAAASRGPKVVQERIHGGICVITRRSTGGHEHGGRQDGENMV